MFEGLDWFQLTQDRDEWRDFVKTVKEDSRGGERDIQNERQTFVRRKNLSGSAIPRPYLPWHCVAHSLALLLLSRCVPSSNRL